jgi:hypothetical protein
MVDAAGTVYVVWQDCRFRAACASNDMVLSTSPDGNTWTTPVRVPIDSTGSTVDHFIPGLTVDPATSGTGAHLALAYYFYTQSACTAATCSLNAGFISSPDGGNTWTTPITLTRPMSLAWLPNTSSGVMVGDYIAATYVNGKAYPVFASAQANSGSLFNEAIYTTTTPLTAVHTAQARVKISSHEPVLSNHSDHPPKRFEDVDRDLYPTKPPNQ